MIEWNDGFSVKTAEIDGQHKRLVSMINELNDGMKERRAKDILGGVIRGLLEYAAMHFATEERYFDRFNYTGAAVHKQEHQDFVAKATRFKEDFDRGRLALSVQVMTFLSGWLIEHIKGSDQKYSTCFNGSGLN